MSNQLILLIIVAVFGIFAAIFIAAWRWEKSMGKERDQAFAAWARSRGLAYAAGPISGGEFGLDAEVTNISRGEIDGYALVVFDAARWVSRPGRTASGGNGLIVRSQNTYARFALPAEQTPPTHEQNLRWQIDIIGQSLLMSWRRELEPQQLDEFTREAVQVVRQSSGDDTLHGPIDGRAGDRQ
jgi:hypothetical protein